MADRRLPGLGDSWNWEPFWQFSKAQTDAEWGSGRSPIGIQEQLFGLTLDDSNVIATYITANNDPGHWRWAGFANQRIRTGLTVGGAVDTELNPSKQKTYLKRLSIIIFPKLSPEWALSLEFPRWLRSVTVIVFKYIGEDFDTIDVVGSQSPNEAINLDTRLELIELDLQRTLDGLDRIENQL